jgi:hypothetical protein
MTGDSFITFVSPDGLRFHVELEGDCCSSSFFDDNSKLDAEGLLGEQLMSIEEVGRERPESDPLRHRTTEHIEYHALLIRTDKQSITVDWRNESNGYYDGWVNVWLDGQKLNIERGPVVVTEVSSE